MPLLKVTIDNIEVEVEAGTTIMNAARKIGGKVVPPAMCYYSKLEGSGGKCRTCLVKVAQGSARDPARCQNWSRHAVHWFRMVWLCKISPPLRRWKAGRQLPNSC